MNHQVIHNQENSTDSNMIECTWTEVICKRTVAGCVLVAASMRWILRWIIVVHNENRKEASQKEMDLCYADRRFEFIA
jgi:hypothetical protein